jgi:hypothetical protein
VPRDQRGADLIQGAVTNWALPTDTDYSLVNVTRGKAIRPDTPLSTDLVSDRDELEIQPVLVAGDDDERW